MRKEFFNLFLLSLAIFSATSTCAQTIEDEIQWFQHFSRRHQNVSVETLLARNQANLDTAAGMGDLNGKAKAYMEMGMTHLHRTLVYEKAIDALIEGLAIYDSLDDDPGRIVAYILIAEVFEVVGNPHKTEEMLVEAQVVNRRLGNDHFEAIILNRLGKVNALRADLEKAEASFEGARQRMDAFDDLLLSAQTDINLGHLYTTQGEYARALETHKRALNTIRRMRDRYMEGQSLNDIGELYATMKNTERAFANHEAALEIRTELKDDAGQAQSHNQLGVLYFDQDDYAHAMEHLHLGLDIARKAQAHEEIRRAHEYLSRCYEARGDYPLALAHKNELVMITDFIRQDNNDRQLLEAQNRYVVDEKQSQIRTLETIRQKREEQLRQQAEFQKFLFAVIGLGTVIVFLVAYLYLTIRRSNRKLKVAHAKVQEQNVQLTDLNATKDKFFSIIGHDLKGPLNSLTSFSSLLLNHTDSLTKDEIRMLATDLDKSLKNLFSLLENLLEWARSQTGNIDFERQTFDLVPLVHENKALLQKQAANKNIAIEVRGLEAITVAAHKQSVNTVIRNLISNAIKFTPAGGRITVETTWSSDALVVSVADTGVGMTDDVMKKLFRLDAKHSTKGTADEKGTGLGLILCKDFVEKNGGRIWVESTPGKGSVFSFTVVPAEGQAAARGKTVPA